MDAHEQIHHMISYCIAYVPEGYYMACVDYENDVLEIVLTVIEY